MADPATVTAAPRALAAWREHDHRYRRFGFSIWLTGAEFSIGRRFYRVRWAFHA
jgi:hypothetical protein